MRERDDTLPPLESRALRIGHCKPDGRESFPADHIERKMSLSRRTHLANPQIFPLSRKSGNASRAERLMQCGQPKITRRSLIRAELSRAEIPSCFLNECLFCSTTSNVAAKRSHTRNFLALTLPFTFSTPSFTFALLPASSSRHTMRFPLEANVLLYAVLLVPASYARYARSLPDAGSICSKTNVKRSQGHPVAAIAARPRQQTWGKYKGLAKRQDADTQSGAGTPTEQHDPGYSPLPVINGGTISQSIQTQLKVSFNAPSMCPTAADPSAWVISDRCQCRHQ